MARSRTRLTWRSLVSLVTGLSLSLTACVGVGVSGQAKRPNVLVIVADDMGYSDIGAFGSEIATPHIDALAGDGRLLTNFRTAPACAPTRAMLMSGTDSHLAGAPQLEGNTTALLNARNAPFGVSFGFDDVPGAYAGRLRANVATLPELLRDAGYHTYMAGKWHLASVHRSTPTPGAYFDPSAYPNKKGFERSYALLSGAGAHFAPTIGKPTTYDRATYTEDDVEFKATSLPADFYSTKHFTDKLISYIDSNIADGKPFFAYAAYTAPHWPLQAPDADVAAQAGRYNEGYDVIRTRRIEKMKTLGVLPKDFVPNPGLASVAEGGIGKKRWSELTVQERALQARAMEVYAAQVNNLDTHIGRIVRYLKDKGQYDNTLIFFMSDNGADPSPARGGAITSATSLADIGKPGTPFAYGERWAEVSSAPFRLWKTLTGAEGSVSVPAIVKLLGNAKAATISHSTMLVKDLLPTFLDYAKVPVPKGSYAGRTITPITGVSLRAALESAHSAHPVRPASETVAMEYFGLGYVLRGDGWKLSQSTTPGVNATSYTQIPWRLYNLTTDRGETRDVAAENPAIVSELLTHWNKYVADNEVLLPSRPPQAKRDNAGL
jgi:arylsulfatase A-like enzyme